MLIYNRMKWPVLANGRGAFINLLKVRQLNESGHRLGWLTVREGKGLRGEERTIQASRVFAHIKMQQHTATHSHTEEQTVYNKSHLTAGQE